VRSTATAISGRGCLLARRLVEAGRGPSSKCKAAAGTTHDDVFNRVSKLASDVDPGMAALVSDLKERGQLDRTLVVWMASSAAPQKSIRAPAATNWPSVFNVAIAGGGIRGGQVIGTSAADGTRVQDRPVTNPRPLLYGLQVAQGQPANRIDQPAGRPLKIRRWRQTGRRAVRLTLRRFPLNDPTKSLAASYYRASRAPLGSASFSRRTALEIAELKAGVMVSFSRQAARAARGRFKKGARLPRPWVLMLSARR